MTQEDWSGTGEASDTSSAGSWNEPAADAEALGDPRSASNRKLRS